MTGQLEEIERRLIANAQQVEALRGVDSIREFTGQADILMAHVDAFAAAQKAISDLLSIIGRLDGTDPEGVAVRFADLERRSGRGQSADVAAGAVELCQRCRHRAHPETPLECGWCPEGYCEARRG
jgi:hypothetical protein